MQVVQKLHKPDYVKTFKDLAQVFTDKIIDLSSADADLGKKLRGDICAGPPQ